jgi:hypothetical protein
VEIRTGTTSTIETTTTTTAVKLVTAEENA